MLNLIAVRIKLVAYTPATIHAFWKQPEGFNCLSAGELMDMTRIWHGVTKEILWSYVPDAYLIARYNSGIYRVYIRYNSGICRLQFPFLGMKFNLVAGAPVYIL